MDSNNYLMRNDQPPVRSDLAMFEGYGQDKETEGAAIGDLIRGLIRRWPMILIISLVILIPGLSFIWFVIKPGYETKGAIEVTAPQTIIFTIQDESVSDSQTFMRTEAAKIASPPVLNRAADTLAKKQLDIFAGRINLVEALQGLTASGAIKVYVEKGTNLIYIQMMSSEANKGDAQEVVDALINAYIAVRAEVSTQGEYDRLSYLETQKKILNQRMQMQRSVIRRLAEEYGTTDIGARQQMKFEYVARLQSTLNDIETKRIALEAQKELLRDSKIETLDPEKQMKMRFDRVTNDPTVKMLTAEVTLLERQLIVAKKNFAPGNPELARMSETLDAMKKRLAERREEVADTFNDDIMSQMEEISEYKINDIEAELKSLQAHEQKIRETLEKEDQNTRELGQKQLAIEDEKEKLNDIKDLLETVRRRITQLEMEGKRPARISVAYYASSLPAKTKQMKFTMVCLFGAFGAGVFVAFLAERADPRLRTPKDVVSQVGIPIIGTTSKTESTKKALVASVVAEDYRTIRANLELLCAGGVPERIIITSAGIQEGKTTFSINFATSMAKAGKKVLLIDGDLRKPDVAKALGIPLTRLGLQDMLEGKSFDEVVCRDCIEGMDVLTSVHSNYDPSIACEILNSDKLRNIINEISQGYDNVVIDTPPVLAGPDALLWSKMAGGVILTSYSGQTVRPDMQEALRRLKNCGANVLGSILHCVETDYSYYRYGYDYYTSGQSRKAKRRAEKRPLLLTLDQMQQDMEQEDNI